LCGSHRPHWASGARRYGASAAKADFIDGAGLCHEARLAYDGEAAQVGKQ